MLLNIAILIVFGVAKHYTAWSTSWARFSDKPVSAFCSSGPDCLTSGMTRSHHCVSLPFIFIGRAVDAHLRAFITWTVDSAADAACTSAFDRLFLFLSISSTNPSLPLFFRSFVAVSRDRTIHVTSATYATADYCLSVRLHRSRPTDANTAANTLHAANTDKFERIRTDSRTYFCWNSTSDRRLLEEEREKNHSGKISALRHRDAVRANNEQK